MFNRARLAITVHLGLDDVKLVLGAAADDLHPLLADLLDQRLFEAIFFINFSCLQLGNHYCEFVIFGFIGIAIYCLRIFFRGSDC